ncbi:MAG: ABC transporter permease [Treponemataceae bacterium]
MKPTTNNSRSMPGGWKDTMLPLFSILIVLIPILIIRPRVMSFGGFQLLFNMAMPIALVTIAQMFAMSIGEIDFSLGNLISLVTCIAGTIIPYNLALGLLCFAGILVVYMLIGAFLYLRKLPSIVVTIGMSFIWTGIATTIQPSPGGNVPRILEKITGFKTPFIPMPLIFLAILALFAYLIVFKTNIGILMRGVGGNPKAINQSGHSILKTQIIVFGFVGLFGILGGLALAGITTSADANMARNYTLIAVASVILGGGTFAGGKVSPVGAVLGACTMTLVGTLLTFLQISPDWQIGAQGAIILAVLFLNSILKRRGKVHYV